VLFHKDCDKELCFQKKVEEQDCRTLVYSKLYWTILHHDDDDDDVEED
jgi:hypothetical protein